VGPRNRISTIPIVEDKEHIVSNHYQLAVDAYALTTGRLLGAVAALVALAGVVVAVPALTRSGGRIGKRGSVAGLVAGLIGMVVGGLVVANADGGPGTGGGIVGGFAALVIGLVAVVLGWTGLARARHTV
jgi:hypothetical protein